MSGFLNRGGFVYSSSKRLGDERGPQAAYVVVAAAAASSLAGAALAGLALSTATGGARDGGDRRGSRLRPPGGRPCGAQAVAVAARSRRSSPSGALPALRGGADVDRVTAARSRANHVLPRCRDDRATHDPTRPL